MISFVLRGGLEEARRFLTACQRLHPRRVARRRRVADRAPRHHDPRDRPAREPRQARHRRRLHPPLRRHRRLLRPSAPTSSAPSTPPADAPPSAAREPRRAVADRGAPDRSDREPASSISSKLAGSVRGIEGRATAGGWASPEHPRDRLGRPASSLRDDQVLRREHRGSSDSHLALYLVGLARPARGRGSRHDPITRVAVMKVIVGKASRKIPPRRAPGSAARPAAERGRSSVEICGSAREPVEVHRLRAEHVPPQAESLRRDQRTRRARPRVAVRLHALARGGRFGERCCDPPVRLGGLLHVPAQSAMPELARASQRAAAR